MAAFLDLYPTQALLPELAAEFSVGPATAALTVTAGTAAVALTAPLTGILADRLGRKRLIVAACLLLVLPTLLVAQAGSIGELLFWRFCQGLLLPAIFAVTVAYVGEEFPPGEVVRASGLYIAGTILGGFLGRFLVALLAERHGWRAGFAGLAGLNLTLGLALWLLLPPARHFTPAARFSDTLAAMGRHLRRPNLLVTFGIGFGVLFSLVALFTYANFHLAAPPFSLGTAALGSIFIVYLTGVFASPWTGRLVKHVGRRGALLCAALLCCCGLALCLLPSLIGQVAGLAIGCGGLFIAQSLATGFIAGNAPEARTAAVGLYVTSYYIGGSLGAILPAPLWHWGGWPAVLALVATLQIGMALLGWRWWRETGA
jgi:predicted MFS family arabinose efflux permease